MMLAGIGMYLLAYDIIRKHEPAVLSAIVFMLCGHVMAKIYNGVIIYPEGLPWMPLILLAFKKAVETRNWAGYTILSAVFFAFQFHAGAYDYVIYTGMLVAFYIASVLLQSKGRETGKIIRILVLMGLLGAGLSAVKLVPTLDFVQYTNRSAPYELKYAFDPDAPANTITFGNMFERLVWNGAPGRENQGNIGFVAWILVLASLLDRRKTWVKLNWAILIFTILYAMGTPVYDFCFYLFPLVNKIRYGGRILVLFGLASGILAGFGAAALYEYLKRSYKQLAQKQQAFYAIVAILLVADMAYVNYHLPRMEDPVKKVASAEIQNYIAELQKKDGGIYRTHSFETAGIDTPMQEYTTPLGLDILYGVDGALWITEYMQYLGVSWYNPPKFWGMLNVKYLTAQKELNYTDFALVRKFEKCAECAEIAYGPYLYENKMVRERAINPGNAILVVGNAERATEMTYWLWVNQNITPAATTIVKGDEPEIIKYDRNFLKRFNVILLAPGSLGGADITAGMPPALKRVLGDYTSSGGVLLPDITKGETGIDPATIPERLRSLSAPANPVKIASYGPNEVEVDVSGRKGLLVMGEKYFMFPEEWKAHANDGRELKMYRADGMATAVEIPENARTIRFTYAPKNFTLWAAVSAFTTLAVIAYAAKTLLKKGGKTGGENPKEQKKKPERRRKKQA